MMPTIHVGNDRATGKPVRVPLRTFLGKHAHCVGAPNSGKSRWLFSFVRQLVAMGILVIVLDLKGDLFVWLLDELVRQRRHRRVVVLDPYDAVGTDGRTACLNPLDDRADPAIVAGWTKDSFKREFRHPPGQFNSHIDDALLSGLNLLTHTRDADGEPWTPFELSRVLSASDATFRHRLLERCDEPEVHERFAEVERFSRVELLTIWNPVQTRLFQWRVSLVMPPHVGASRASVDPDAFLAQRTGGVMLARLADARLPVSDTNFLATLLLQRLQGAVFRRPRRDWDAPVFLVVDEVQKAVGTAGDEFCDFLERSRSFGLHCWAAHQFLSQLVPPENPADTRFRDGLTQVTGIRAYFNVGARDTLAGGLVDETFLPEIHALTGVKKHVTPARRTRLVEETRRVRQRSAAESDSWAEGESESGGTGASESSSTGSSFAAGEGASSTLLYPASGGLILPGGFGPAGALSEGSSRFTQQAAADLHGSSTTDFSGWATSRSRGGGRMRGASEAIVPWLRPEEVVEEGQPTFFSCEEARLQYARKLHRQGQRCFVLQVGTEAARELISPTVAVPEVFSREVLGFKGLIYPGYTVPTAAVLAALHARVEKFLTVAAAEEERRTETSPPAVEPPNCWEEEHPVAGR
jgi:hypothetical protein